MGKDPAFLFYSQDFYMGTLEMNHEEVGIYIRILILMHQKGRMTEESICSLVGCKLPEKVRAKFKEKDGLLFNERFESEVEKRRKYSESRRNNAKSKPKKRKNISKAHAQHMENENENRNKDINVDEIEYPFTSDEFLKWWAIWKQFKKQQFRFIYKPIGEQAALKKLATLSDGDEHLAFQIIEQSLANGWKGFFELKTNGQKHEISQSLRNWASQYDQGNL